MNLRQWPVPIAILPTAVANNTTRLETQGHEGFVAIGKLFCKTFRCSIESNCLVHHCIIFLLPLRHGILDFLMKELLIYHLNCLSSCGTNENEHHVRERKNGAEM